MTDRAIAPVPPLASRFKPGQSGNPSGMPKNFRRPTDALRQLVGIRGGSVEEVVTRFKTARGRDMRGADHLAVTAFTKACDAESRSGDAMFREILDRLDGPVMRNLKVESEEKLTIYIVPLDALLDGKVSPQALEVELRRKALQAAALEAEVVEEETSGRPAGDASPGQGGVTDEASDGRTRALSALPSDRTVTGRGRPKRGSTPKLRPKEVHKMRNHRLRSLILTMATMALPLTALAQGRPDSTALIAAQREAMVPLAYMDGVWRGPAWTIVESGEKHNITQTERIGPFLDGSVKVIEGRGYDPDGKVTFNAFGIISYSPEKRNYVLHSYAMGYVGDFALTRTAEGYVWEIPAGPTTMRYTAVIKDGAWREVGDRILPGKEPIRFFEMNLKRVTDTTWPAAGAIGPK